MYKIENGVPLPPLSKGGKKAKYPFRDLEVGQSFFAGVSGLNSTQWTDATGYQYSVRRTTENGIQGCRVWRTA